MKISKLELITVYLQLVINYLDSLKVKSKIMKCVILDFCTNNVDIVTVPNDVAARISIAENEKSEDDANDIIESWLSSNYRVDDISYMYGDNMVINFK